MTRKQIEERCRKEMQQSIQDKEALWQRIEQQLPAQKPMMEKTQQASQAHESLRMTALRRTLTAAACFLLVAAGVSVYARSGRLDTQNDKASNDLIEENAESFMNEAPEDAYENEGEAAAPMDTEPLRYDSLQFAESAQRVTVLDRSQLGIDNAFFNEDAVLAQTECFVDVKVHSGQQDPESGIMTYTLEVVNTFGMDVLEKGAELTVQTYSAYILEAGHEYLLPLYMEENSWKLSYECAPQLELTLDGKAVYHSGWQSLQRVGDRALICESHGADDYFYDRMYLGDAGIVLTFVETWAAQL